MKTKLCTALVLAGLGVVGLARGAARDPAQEAAIDKAVRDVDPSLVGLVHQGNDAMDRGDAASAAKAYASVHERAPAVNAVTRRLGVAQAREGNVRIGIRTCRQALAEQASAENHAALASVLGIAPSGDELVEAEIEAKKAVRLAPQTEYAQATLCDIAALRADRPVLEQCSAALQTIAPTAAETHLYAALVHALHAEYDEAEGELDAARAAGLPDALATETHEQIERARPHIPLRVRIVTGVAEAFIATLFLLFVLGMLLGDAAAKSKSRPVRALYAAVVVASAVFYDVFAALLGLVILVIAALGVYLFVAITRPPLVARIIAGMVGAYLLFALLRASLASVPRGVGVALDLEREAKLKKMLDAVAKQLGERPIDEVHVRPDAWIDLEELGGVIGHLRKKNKRRLTIGVFALEGLSLRALQALVAREHARYRGRDAAAIVARARLDAIANRMTARGVAVVANPAWWLVAGYRWIFARISDTAASLQEAFVDEQASALYGSKALLEGMRHLVRRDVALDGRRAEIVREVIDATAPPPTLGTFDEAWAHYSNDEKRIEALDEDGLVAAEEGTAWDLFRSRADIERAAQERLQALVDEELGISAAAPSP